MYIHYIYKKHLNMEDIIYSFWESLTSLKLLLFSLFSCHIPALSNDAAVLSGRRTPTAYCSY